MSQTILNKIVDEFDLDGGKQSYITKELFGSGVLFEFLEPDQRDKIVDIYNDGRMQTWVESYHEQSAAEHPLEVYEGVNPGSHEVARYIVDDDTGEEVQITPAMRDEALQLHGQVEGAFWQLATALARIKNERLYLALGFSSFKGYCADTLPFGVRNAYHYALVGEKIGLRLLNGDSGVNPGSRSELEELGIKKLRLLASKAEDQIQRLIEEGKITIGSEEMDASQLADRRVSELKEMLQRANDKAQKAELLEEQKKNLELEKEALEEEAVELNAFKKRHLERAEQQDEIEETLQEMEHCKEQLMRAATRLGYSEHFDQVARDDQKERLVQFLGLLSDGVTRLKNKHFELITLINEESQDI